MKGLILGYFNDKQTANYILDAFQTLNYEAAGVDIRMLVKDVGMEKAQSRVFEEIKKAQITPDLIIVLKGLELKKETLVKIKEMFPKAILCNWFFDKMLGPKPIYEIEEYFDTIRLFDYYFCSLKGVADKLNEKGLKNARYLDEGCDPRQHGEIFLNNFQKRMYGSDVAFIGTIGLKFYHPQRMKILDKVISEGFNTKVWGPTVGSWEMIPERIKACHMKKGVANRDHSKVVQASLINLGIDQDTNIELGHSARLYRVLCAGGLYLTNCTKFIGNMFYTNQRDGPITDKQEIVVYHNGDDLIKKLDFLLEHDELREKIAKNGQKAVLAKHKFTDRLKEMLEVIKNGSNAMWTQHIMDDKNIRQRN